MGTILHEEGDGIKGEKVTAQCRKPDFKGKIRGTGSHRLNRVSLEGTVFCVIDKPLKKFKEKIQHID